MMNSLEIIAWYWLIKKTEWVNEGFLVIKVKVCSAIFIQVLYVLCLY